MPHEKKDKPLDKKNGHPHCGHPKDDKKNDKKKDTNQCVMDTKTMKEQLLPYLGKKIQLIIGSAPPGAKASNITGILITLEDKYLQLRLSSGHEGSQKIATFLLSSLLGFVPLGNGDDGGCGKDSDPLEAVLLQYVGKRTELSFTDGTTKQGVILEVSGGVVKVQLDQTTSTTTPLIGTYLLTSISGVVDLNPKGNGQSGGSSHGKITVQVYIMWQGDKQHPEEVDVKFIRDGIATTVRTIGGVATFISEPTGKLIIQGSDVPGFITPSMEIRLKGNTSFVEKTLTYIASSIAVSGVLVEPAELRLLEGITSKLNAFVLPQNADNQLVSWNSSDDSIASVDGDGVVTAHEKGSAIITVTTAENAYSAQCAVYVLEVTSVVPIDDINAIRNEVVVLPETVNVVLSDSTLISLPVVWMYEGAPVGATFKVPDTDAVTEYMLTGAIQDADGAEAQLLLIIDPSQTAIDVTGLTLNVVADSLYVGEMMTILAQVEPIDATTKAVTFISQQPSIATVSAEGVVTAISPGTTVIEVTTVDGSFKKYVMLSVSAVPEIELIYSVEGEYATYEEVVINVENLVEARITKDTKYYIKIEQTGAQAPVGTGEIILTTDTKTFRPSSYFTITPQPQYNNLFFLYMSTDPSFPKSDEQTLSTNFKIESSVPVFNPDDLHVDLTILGGSLSGMPGGITFILAREIDKPIEEITWLDYVSNLSPLEFIDEVKLKGTTDDTGVVVWETPAESLKLGGYVLLLVTPEGYVDNLNLLNPDTGELVKVVALERDGVVYRHVTCVPVE